MDLKGLQAMATILRRDSIEMTTAAGSGHPTSCMSCADIMSALFFHSMSYDTKDPNNLNSDQFILSKGHAAPILYAALKRAGCIDDDLLTLRKINSRLEGHPNPRSFPWVKVGTGSLGQGLSIGLGMALAAREQKRDYMTYVLLGDGEIAEGSVYEALELAAEYNANNLCAIVDVNRLGQSGPTMIEHKMSVYKKRFASFGWNVMVVNGHNMKAVVRALDKAKKSKKPTCILAKTYKGYGVSSLQDHENWHGKALKEEDALKALEELGDIPVPSIKISTVKKNKVFTNPEVKLVSKYKKGDMVATRDAYGVALTQLAKKSKWLVATDGEVRGSTRADKMLKADPTRFFDGYIAEQNLVGMSLGLAVQGHPVFTSTFAAFFTRAHDQIRMGSLSSVNLNYVGSHVGVSIGTDGVSQMALGDLGMFRSFPDMKVVCPSDGVSAIKLLEQMYNDPGQCYMRTARPNTPILYNNSESFPIGTFKIVHSLPKPKALILGMGVTVAEASAAFTQLKKEGINTSVLDCYSLKPFDDKKLQRMAKGVKRVIVVEDHYQQGGLGERVARSLTGMNVELVHLYVHGIPHSGQPRELMEFYGIDSKAIVKAVKK